VIGVVVRDTGLVLDESLPPARAGGCEVVVEMEAACVSPLDVQIAAGRFPVRPAVPYVAGIDGAGRILSGPPPSKAGGSGSAARGSG
jgi:NADPH:quinone reductase